MINITVISTTGEYLFLLKSPAIPRTGEPLVHTQEGTTYIVKKVSWGIAEDFTLNAVLMVSSNE